MGSIPYLYSMFIRETKKSNSTSVSSPVKLFLQYVLVQAHRIDGKARQRNVLYLGSHKFLHNKDLRRRIAKALEEKIYGQKSISEAMSQYEMLDDEYKKHVDEWYNKYLEKEQNGFCLSKPSDKDKATFEEVDTSGIDTTDCREVGAEWLCLNMCRELKIDTFLRSKGFNPWAIDRALVSIISRSVYPTSERKTAQWLFQNSALSELFDTINCAPDRFVLYRMAAKLSEHFDDFTDHVYKTTMDMFGLKDTLMIYDLTNSYFEGRKLGSLLAKFGRSKEKRNDCRLVSISAVVNRYGFLKYSKIDQGNICESKTLLGVIKQMKAKSKTEQLNKVVVIDASIATEDNLEALRKSKEKYVCVSRVVLKDYDDHTTDGMRTIYDKEENEIEIKLIDPKDKPDKWLIVKSQMKKKKELSMLTKSEQKYEEKLQNIEQAIHKNRGTKKINKVWERIGRAKESSKKAHSNFDIQIKEENGIALSMSWTKKDSTASDRTGVYFIRTNLNDTTDEQIWDIYNTIREVESTFRCLKTDLSIRPIFHKKDKYSEAHIHLGLMAYQIVTAIRHQLKQHHINLDWTNIVRIMNSQKMNTIKMKMRNKEVHIRKMSQPEEVVKKVYEIMGIKKFPKPTKKYVVYH